MSRKIKNLEEYTEKTLLGADLYNKGNFSQALEVFQELAEYNSSNFKVHETLALIYLKLGKLDEAAEAYRKARTLFSQESGVNIPVRSFEEAVAELESVDKLEAVYEKNMSDADSVRADAPDLHKLPIMLGLHYMASGEYKKAENLLMQHREKFFKK